MMEYPRSDSKITMFLSDGKEITGFVNIAGRDMVSYLQAPEPDILLYGCETNNVISLKTLFVSKKHVLWIAPQEPDGKEEGSRWQSVRIMLENGEMITGSVNVTGYDRLSDFFRLFDDPFLEVYNGSMGERAFERIYISPSRIIWKAPVE